MVCCSALFVCFEVFFDAEFSLGHFWLLLKVPGVRILIGTQLEKQTLRVCVCGGGVLLCVCAQCVFVSSPCGLHDVFPLIILILIILNQIHFLHLWPQDGLPSRRSCTQNEEVRGRLEGRAGTGGGGSLMADSLSGLGRRGL